MPIQTPGEVLFEYIPMGNAMRITAIDAATGTEVTLQAPLTLSHGDMQQLAYNKLAFVMRREKK